MSWGGKDICHIDMVCSHQIICIVPGLSMSFTAFHNETTSRNGNWISRHGHIHTVRKAKAVLNYPNLALTNDLAVWVYQKFQMGKVRAGSKEGLQAKDTKFGEVVIANVANNVHWETK